MKNQKALFTIALIVFIDLLGFGIIIPLLPYIAENFSANASQIGFLVATYSLFQFISSPILGRLSDRYGRKKLLFLSQIGSSLGFLILGLATSLPLLFLARIIDGITGGNISIAQAYIADITDSKNRARGMGLIGAAFGLGFMLGPAIGGVLSNISFSAPAYFASVIALLAAILSATFLNETVNIKTSPLHKTPKLNFSQLKHVLTLQPIGLIIIVFFLLSLGFSGISGTFALWTQDSFGWGPKEVGYIFTFIGTISVITQTLIVPKAVSKFGERKIVKTATPIMALGFILIPLSSPRTIYFANLFIVLGNSLAGPTIQAIASESVNKNEYGGTLGILQSSGSLGRIVGPIIAGFFYESISKNIPYFFSGIIILLVSLLLIYNLDDKEAILIKLRKSLHL